MIDNELRLKAISLMEEAEQRGFKRGLLCGANLFNSLAAHCPDHTSSQQLLDMAERESLYLRTLAGDQS